MTILPTIVESSSRSHGRRKKQPRRRTTSSPLQAYIDCMNNPFECAPARLGFGTFIPTQVATAYLKGSFATNATDGSFNFVAFPSISYSVLTSSVGAGAAPFWIANNSQNASAIAQTMGQARCIAMGVRIFPMIAATSPPGMVALGLSASAGSANALTTSMTVPATTCFNAPFMNVHKATSGTSGALQVLWRPEDVSDMELDRNNSITAAVSINASTGVATGINDIGPYIVISGLGLPPSTTIWYEYIFHLEGTAGVTANGVSSANIEDESATTVRGEGQVPNLEMLYSKVVNSLAPLSASISDAAPYVFKAYTSYKDYTKGSLVSGPAFDPSYVTV